MVLDINLLSPAVIVGVFVQIEGLFVVSEKLNWQIRYVIKIELIDRTCNPDNIFICRIYSNILGFSCGSRDNSVSC